MGIIVCVDNVGRVIVVVAVLADVGVFHRTRRKTEVDKEKACTGRKWWQGLAGVNEFLWSTAKVVQSCRLCQCACCLHTKVQMHGVDIDSCYVLLDLDPITM